MDKFCLVVNESKDKDGVVTQIVMDFLEKSAKDYYVLNKTFKKNGENHLVDEENIPDDLDCMIVLGGDGTILQTARDVVWRQIPIVGINLGTLGFLAEIEKKDLVDALEQLVQGKFQMQHRMMLSGSINKSDGSTFNNIALNDIVIGRNGFSRIIQLKIYVNGELVDVYEADGIIVATPTGSTAYNLSAGGPVMLPSTEMMVITPICPHSLTSKSIVVSGNDTIFMEIGRLRKTQTIEAMATFDGQIGIAMGAGDTIQITMAKEKTKIITLGQVSFYKILRSKMI